MSPTLENPFTPKSAIPTKRLFGGEERVIKRKISAEGEARLKKAKELGLVKYGEHEIKKDQVDFLYKLEDEIIRINKAKYNQDLSKEKARENLLYIFGKRNRIQTDDSGNIITLQLLNILLYSLPKEIRNLKRLEILNCSQTELVIIPREIGGLKNLKILSCADCKLSEIPKEIGKLKKLEGLILRGTYIGDIPEELGDLKKLEQVDLRDNMNIMKAERKKIIELFEYVKDLKI